MKKGICLLMPSLLALLFLKAQVQVPEPPYKTWNPATAAFPVLEGQAWPGAVKHFYDRLPATAESQVRPEVWNLSENSAGLLIRFISNAGRIIVRYAVSERLQMPHMPATGVSGVDLYSKTIDGNWTWCAGRYSFGDTIQYHFNNLISNDQHVGNREYSLYLPLYNSVKWLEISVPEGSSFQPLPVRADKPVLVYGTSIAQGGCASRPGMAWTAILGRKLDRPMINLGFSGNGRLEKEVLDRIAEVDASIFVLDCLPNLIPPAFSTGEVKRRIRDAVLLLQSKRPGTPILLTDHEGYSNGATNAVSREKYEEVNTALKETFDSLVAAGVKNIYRLSREEIGQDIESMVDGVHPSDLGMMHYATAYEQKIRAILNEPKGNGTTCIPVTQRRDAATYDWETRHRQVLDFNRDHSPDIVFIGNSITHYWGGLPAAPIARGAASWNKYFDPRHAENLGFGWDRIENCLWRVYHGELDHISPKQIVIMIGTNNLQLNSDEEIAEGLQFLLKAIREKQPVADILLLGILPRRDQEQRIARLNQRIAALPLPAKVRYADAGSLFLKTSGKIDESLFTDGLHPNAAGYEKLGRFIDEHAVR